MKRIILFGWIVFLVPHFCMAATFNVPGDRPTIQAAIDVAVDGDIILLQDGTYTGVGNCDIDFKGKSATVKSIGGADNCIIDCQQLGGWFLLYLGEAVVIEGLTICNAYTEDDGGAVHIYGSTLIVSDCNFKNNKASYGGAVCLYYSLSSFTNCTFTANEATNSGGAVYFYSSSANFTGCNFMGNGAYSGGATYFSSSPYLSTFTNCMLTDNVANRGGAVYSSYSSYSFTNCTLTRNEASAEGGALWSYIPIAPEDPVTLRNSIIWGNDAPVGSELFESGKNMVISYSDIKGVHTVISGNLPSLSRDTTGDIYNLDTNPLFLSIDTTGDLYLHPYSPCIDSGTEDGAPADDIDGYIRPIGLGYDIGAHEYPYNVFIWEGQTLEWNDIGNWNYNELPKSTDLVVLSSPDAVSSPEINFNEATAEKLIIESGTLTIEEGRLTVGGS